MPLPADAIRGAYIPPVPSQMAPGQERMWLSQIADKLNLLLRRATSAQVTLQPNATETTLYDNRFSRVAAVHIQAITASAADTRQVWVELGDGVAIFHHDNSPATDRTYSVILR